MGARTARGQFVSDQPPALAHRAVILAGAIATALGIAGGLGFALEPGNQTQAGAAALAPLSVSTTEPMPGAPGALLNVLPELPADLLTAPAPVAAGTTVPAPAPEAAGITVPAPAVAGPAAPVVPMVAAPAPTAIPDAVAPPAAAATPVAAPPAAAAPAKPNFYVPEVAAGGQTDLEARLLAGLNAERAAAGLAPYSYDSGLSRIARTRVRQLADQNYFGHVDPAGYTMYSELLAYFGYTSYAWAGENLAMNNYGAIESPERAMVALMKSPTHKANILDREFSRVGIGEFTTADGRHFYAMIFLG